MKKSTPTMKDYLVQTEKHLRKQAEQIIKAKEIGVSQQSIDKMIAWISISKAYYDDMKGRFEKRGK